MKKNSFYEYIFLYALDKSAVLAILNFCWPELLISANINIEKIFTNSILGTI